MVPPSVWSKHRMTIAYVHHGLESEHSKLTACCEFINTLVIFWALGLRFVNLGIVSQQNTWAGVFTACFMHLCAKTYNHWIPCWLSHQNPHCGQSLPCSRPSAHEGPTKYRKRCIVLKQTRETCMHCSNPHTHIICMKHV